MNKIRKGDDVIVLTGRDKGKRGVVIGLGDGGLILVEGINRVKKCVKPNPMKGQPGGIVNKELPIAVSNVALFNSASGKADRIGFRVLEDGRKVRVFKSNGEVVDA